jgi:predicted dinucleotide-binding enzyme
MRIGILGNGAVAVALGTVWDRAGHDVLVAGRSYERAVVAAGRIGGRARAVDDPVEAVAGRDAVLLAVAWEGVAGMLRAVGAEGGSLAGTVLIDPTNAVEHGEGVLLPGDGRAAAEYIADLAPGARVVKGFHLFPSTQWAGTGTGTESGNGEEGRQGNEGGEDAPGGKGREGGTAGGTGTGTGVRADADVGTGAGTGGGTVTVVLAGDDEAALETVSALVRDAGGRPAVLGSLARARQLEEVAGFVIKLAFSGLDPNAAIPRVPVPVGPGVGTGAGTGGQAGEPGERAGG